LVSELPKFGCIYLNIHAPILPQFLLFFVQSPTLSRYRISPPMVAVGANVGVAVALVKTLIIIASAAKDADTTTKTTAAW